MWQKSSLLLLWAASCAEGFSVPQAESSPVVDVVDRFRVQCPASRESVRQFDDNLDFGDPLDSTWAVVYKNNKGYMSKESTEANNEFLQAMLRGGALLGGLGSAGKAEKKKGNKLERLEREMEELFEDDESTQQDTAASGAEATPEAPSLEKETEDVTTTDSDPIEAEIVEKNAPIEGTSSAEPTSTDPIEPETADEKWDEKAQKEREEKLEELLKELKHLSKVESMFEQDLEAKGGKEALEALSFNKQIEDVTTGDDDTSSNPVEPETVDEEPPELTEPIAVARLRRSTDFEDCWVLDTLRCSLAKNEFENGRDGGSEHCEAIGYGLDALLLDHLETKKMRAFVGSVRVKSSIVSAKLLESRGFVPIDHLATDFASHVFNQDMCIGCLTERVVSEHIYSTGVKVKSLKLSSLLSNLPEDNREDPSIASRVADNDPYAPLREQIPQQWSEGS